MFFRKVVHSPVTLRGINRGFVVFPRFSEHIGSTAIRRVLYIISIDIRHSPRVTEVGVNLPLDQNPRQLARKQALALEMFERLQNQAREVTRVGAAVEADASFRSLAGYRSLRQKVTEFESFCSVIEALIAELPGDSRENVELKFYKLWFTIFRPSLKAFGAFFQRVAGGNQIPFGIGNLLVSELNALEEMREVLQKPRFAGFDDSGLLADLDSLIGLVKTLRDRSTNLAEFAQLQPA